MSLLSRLLKPFVQKTVEQVLTGQSPYNRLYSPNNVVPSFDPNTAIQQYKSWAYIAANKNASAIAGTPLRLFASKSKRETYPKIARYQHLNPTMKKAVRKEGMLQKVGHVMSAEDIVEITEHPFLDLIKNVNPENNQFDFLEETILWLDLTGNCYWNLIPGEGALTGIPQQLWILPSNRMRVVPGKMRLVDAFAYGERGREIMFPPEEVVQFKRTSLADRIYGMSRVEGNWDAIWGLQAIENYEAGMAKNPIPALIAVYKGQLTVKQRRELEREWGRSLDQQAWAKSNLAAIADEAVEIKPIGVPPRDIAMPAGRAVRREQIINAFGQSMALYTENPNRANIEGAIYIWGKYELDPAMSRLSQKLNERILSLYDGGDRLFCCFDKVACDDPQFKLTQDQMDVQNKIRSINEIRKDRGLTPFENEEADDPWAAGAKMQEEKE